MKLWHFHNMRKKKRADKPHEKQATFERYAKSYKEVLCLHMESDTPTSLQTVYTYMSF